MIDDIGKIIMDALKPFEVVEISFSSCIEKKYLIVWLKNKYLGYFDLCGNRYLDSIFVVNFSFVVTPITLQI